MLPDASVTVPGQYLLYGGLALAAWFLLRSDMSNPILDTIRRLLGGLLNWPEQTGLDHLHDSEYERVKCVGELTEWLEEKGKPEAAARLRDLKLEFFD